jgi:cytidine deaminase
MDRKCRKQGFVMKREFILVIFPSPCGTCRGVLRNNLKKEKVQSTPQK